jgi:hypothetical protein
MSLVVARLLAPSQSAMLSAVFAAPLRSGLRRLVRWLALAPVALSTSAPALAQSASSGGWFDPPDEPTYAGQAPLVPGLAAAPAPVSAPASADMSDTDPRALTAFRPALDPYGAWVTDSKYGTVWVPYVSVVGADFVPYSSRGRWALTADEDWIWMSDYPFGWAVFHYGRWVWVPGHGWAWVPGLTYANAWVTWRVPTAGYAYVGWAPLPPTWGWYYGAAVGLWWPIYPPYVYCHSTYVFNHHVHHHIEHDPHKVRRIAEHTQPYGDASRTPARPTADAAARTPRPGAASVAPRGPGMTAARVPTWAVPAQRTKPPNAASLAPARNVTTTHPARPNVNTARSIPTEVTRRQLTPDSARPRSTAPVRPSNDLRREDPARFVAPAPQRIRPLPAPMRDLPRMPPPAPRSRRP